MSVREDWADEALAELVIDKLCLAHPGGRIQRGRRQQAEGEPGSAEGHRGLSGTAGSPRMRPPSCKNPAKAGQLSAQALKAEEDKADDAGQAAGRGADAADPSGDQGVHGMQGGPGRDCRQVGGQDAGRQAGHTEGPDQGDSPRQVTADQARRRCGCPRTSAGRWPAAQVSRRVGRGVPSRPATSAAVTETGSRCDSRGAGRAQAVRRGVPGGASPRTRSTSTAIRAGRTGGRTSVSPATGPASAVTRRQGPGRERQAPALACDCGNGRRARAALEPGAWWHRASLIPDNRQCAQEPQRA